MLRPGLHLLIVGALCYRGAVAKPTALTQTPVAVPTAEQLAWMDMEVGSMITWNLQTICRPAADGNVSSQVCQLESAGLIPDMAGVAAWDPAALNTDEWARVSKSFGAKYVVLVADHMTGFTLWDTALHNFSLAHTAWDGDASGSKDVVTQMIASCKKYGLKLGVFYSFHFNWFLGVDDFKVGHPPLGPRSYTQEEYLEIAKAQLLELVALFDEPGGGSSLHELWFDGGLGPEAGPAVAEALAAAAPGTICHGCTYSGTTIPAAGSVRWMGNEAANMPLPSWAANDGPEFPEGNATGAWFNPPSCDAVLREHDWFYRAGTEGEVKSAKALVNNYLTSVGRAANLILNVAPDATGAVPGVDAARYAEFGSAVACLFDRSRRLGATAAPMAMDSASGAMEPAWEFPPVASGNLSLVVREDQTAGQLIGDYDLECTGGGDGAWEPCVLAALPGVIPATPNAGVGHKRVLLLGPLASGQPIAGLRMIVSSHYATGAQIPTLRDMALYDWSGDAEECV